MSLLTFFLNVLTRTCPPPGALRNGLAVLLVVIFLLPALSFTFGEDPQDTDRPATPLRVPPISFRRHQPPSITLEAAEEKRTSCISAAHGGDI
ncbi:hypothetical protein D4764_21G0003790 [Takifugu flavidus]|uniref:Uncharacterized protein n=1 Tax=Takifugu flavidus TaxID=433684 RepID=A0A5C6NFP1_9TELE|nr:hypothetical protein D4764_21G0003790 [Takifugu flavidus]